MSFRKSLPITRAVRTARTFQTESRHHALVKEHRLTYYPIEERAQAELRARDLLRRAEEGNAWVPSPLYPVGGAAGALLLYLLIRCLSELPVRRVLELGAGQSTRVLDGWAREYGGEAVTFEQNEWWARKVQSDAQSGRVEVKHLPLVSHPAPGGSVEWYAAPADFPTAPFDLVVVDAPTGSARLSRYGVVEHIPEWTAGEWLLLWDDLERPPDLESFALLVERLRARGVEHDHALLDGDTTVGVIHTPGFVGARYMW